jgi:cysteine-rich repeat protein
MTMDLQPGNSQWRKLAHRASMALLAASVSWVLVPNVGTAATVNFAAASIDGTEETPPNGSTAMASGTFVMDTVADTLSYNIVMSVAPPSGETAAHIHGYSGPGVPSGIEHTLPLGTPKIGVWNYPPVREADIINELTYVNIHSNAFLGGEIRGQILRVPSCGDTVVDGGEQCDDGNNTNGDCCDSACQNEPDGQACGVAGSCDSGACITGNNYNCHQVKDLKVPAKFVSVVGTTVVDQTGNFTCEVKKPKFLCNPAQVNGGPIQIPSLHYCCYQTKCVPKKVAVAYDITDQFGTLRLETKKPKFVCTPCEKSP